MFRCILLLHMRSFSKTRECKMTHGGQPINDCSSSCITKCEIMENRDEIDAFIANSKCKARCIHTNNPPKPDDCSCKNVCIADMSELYYIMIDSKKRCE